MRRPRDNTPKRRYDKVAIGKQLHRQLLDDTFMIIAGGRDQIRHLIDNVDDRIKGGKRDWTIEQSTMIFDLYRIFDDLERTLAEIQLIFENGKADGAPDVEDYQELLDKIRALVDGQGSKIIDYKRKAAGNE